MTNIFGENSPGNIQVYSGLLQAGLEIWFYTLFRVHGEATSFSAVSQQENQTQNLCEILVAGLLRGKGNTSFHPGVIYCGHAPQYIFELSVN